MVTIEQKLTLFSKLLNQELKEEIEKKIVELEKEYEAKIAESKYKIDKEAKHIIEDANTILTFKNAKLIPTAKASILVAIANIIISLFVIPSVSSSSSSSSKKPFIILNPINPSNINAIQWSIDVI